MVNYMEHKNIALDVMYGRHKKNKEVKTEKKMWKIKIVKEDARWHAFTAEQKSTVANVCVMVFGSGVAVGLVVGFGM